MTHHILVADDEPDIEALITQKFRHEIRKGDYRFTFVANGEEAYQQLAAAASNAAADSDSTDQIDMVLTDINMPVMDGLELIHRLQTLAHPPKAVVVSAYSDMLNIRAAMNKGAFDFVTKPINFQDLVITLEKTLKAVDVEKTSRASHQQAQLQLLQSEKMSSLGQMMAGVAHEINNPVNFIHGNLKPAQNYVKNLIILVELYQLHYPEPVEAIQSWIEEIDLDFLQEDLSKLFDSLKIGTTRIRELVLSLRNFSRLDEAEKKLVDIHEGIESTLVILANRLKAKPERPEIKITREYATLPKVDCHASQINQVIMNLLSNAVDAFEEHGQCRFSQDRAQEIHINTALVDERWVRITIIDNGPGMSAVTRAKIFEPFFTTKPVGKGTGLGLSISYQIITQKHNGKFSCQSELGEGSQFIIDLPIQ